MGDFTVQYSTVQVRHAEKRKKMEYKVTDNFLPDHEFRPIQILMTEEAILPWFFNERIVSKEQNLPNQFQFTHTFYNNWQWTSEFAQQLNPLLLKINPKAWVRIKANCGTRQEEIIEQGYHVDFPFECTTAVYYLNNNNGYTIFEDGTKVESKANRLVEFPSQNKHSGTSHTDTLQRVVLNLNYFN